MFSGGQTIILEGARLDVIQNPKMFFSTKSPLKPARFEVVSVCYSNLKKKNTNFMSEISNLFVKLYQSTMISRNHLMLLSVIWFQRTKFKKRPDILFFQPIVLQISLPLCFFNQ